jgi:hypothetical protein
MLWTVGSILILFWAFGLVSGYTVGPFIHALLVLGLFVFLVATIQGRKRAKERAKAPHKAQRPARVKS